MLENIKERLITNVDGLIKLLEHFGFEKVVPKVSEIRFARDSNGGPNNIQIRLNNNNGVFVTDYAKGVSSDIISYIINEKKVDFKTVINAIQKIFNLSDDWHEQRKISFFGGVYDNVGKKYEYTIKTYPESIMEEYADVGNKLWVKDGIHLETQKYFGVRFDFFNNGIVFPWRNEMGQIIAVKSRYNGEVAEDQSKYYYPVPGNISYALYGFSENYGDLYSADNIFIFESEKSVMKMYEFGYYNCVALGSHSLSSQQASLIWQLNPKCVTFMLDKNLEYSETLKNKEILRKYSTFSDVPIRMWAWKKNKTLPDKSAPCDGTIDELQKILNEEIFTIKDKKCLTQ